MSPGTFWPGRRPGSNEHPGPVTRHSCRRRRPLRGWHSCVSLPLGGNWIRVRCVRIRPARVGVLFLCCGFVCWRFAYCRFVSCRRGTCAPLGRDQTVQPSNLELDGLQAVALQLEGVGVQAFTGTGQRSPQLLQPFLQPRPPTLEDADPGVGVGSTEEGEVNAEVLVLPGGGPSLTRQRLAGCPAGGGTVVLDTVSESDDGGGG